MKFKIPLLRRILILSLFVACSLLGILSLRAIVLEPFEVPSESMLPTLQIGDIVWINKIAYGVRWPWQNDFRMTTPPQRGDVVVFRHPQTGEYFIKRVIGLPGETVMVLGHRIWVNGEPVEHIRSGNNDEMAFWEQGWGGTGNIREVEISQPAHEYRIFQSNANTVWRHSGFWQVPSDSFFMIGDWRDESSDSRDWGAVPSSLLVGRLECVVDRSDIRDTGPRTRCDYDRAPVFID